MRDRTSVDRRTVLQTIGSSTVAGITFSAPAGASEIAASNTENRAARRNGGDCRDLPSVTEAAANCPDTYVSTVDRVVDGTHIVILLEDGDQTVDQIVVPAAGYPCLEESDTLVVTVDGDELERVRRLR